MAQLTFVLIIESLLALIRNFKKTPVKCGHILFSPYKLHHVTKQLYVCVCDLLSDIIILYFILEKLLSISVKERREMYRTDYISLDQVPVWKHSGD